jgi:uncharacterized membrane protein YhhN
MQLLKKKGILIFWIVLLAHCGMLYLHKTNYAHYSKVLLMPILLLHVFLNAKQNYYSTYKLLFFIALVAAWLGDILLIFEGNAFLIAGMVCFSVTHIANIRFFNKLRPLRVSKSQEAFLAALGMLFIVAQLHSFLRPYTGNLKYPMLAYMLLISTMVVFASNLIGGSGRKTFGIQYFLPAAGLFVLSDAILALNMFYLKEEFMSIVVMLSYGYAQSLFAQGYVKVIKG